MEKTLSNATHDLRERIAPVMRRIQERATDVNHRVLDFVRERPAVSLLGALAAGFLVAWLARRLS